MQFLKTAFWVVLAVAIALFSKANWDIQPSYTGRVPIKLWDDWILLVRLPVLIVVAFLLGLLPMWAFARISIWRVRRRLQTGSQIVPAPPHDPAIAGDPSSAILPSGETEQDAAENAGFRP